MNGNPYFENELSKLGYQGKFTDISHVDELKSEILELRENKKLNDRIFDDYLQFDYEDLGDYNSIAIVAMKLPVVILKIQKNGVTKEILIPSAYYSGGRVDSFNNNMDSFFKDNNIKYKPVHLPCKLILARTGLATYGKNNIAYIDKFGSYFRTRAFLTSLEVSDDNWNEVKQNKLCSTCNICENNCPNNIISNDSYLIDAGKCITFYNEIEDDFPVWIKPEWHNSLIGCMKCQYDCPYNLEYKKDMKVIAHFSDKDVEDIFKSTSLDDLNDDTKNKIKDIEFDDSYKVFKRNFVAVYNNL